GTEPVSDEAEEGTVEPTQRPAYVAHETPAFNPSVLPAVATEMGSEMKEHVAQVASPTIGVSVNADSPPAETAVEPAHVAEHAAVSTTPLAAPAERTESRPETAELTENRVETTAAAEPPHSVQEQPQTVPVEAEAAEEAAAEKAKQAEPAPLLLAEAQP